MDVDPASEFQPLSFQDLAAQEEVTLPPADLCAAAGVDLLFERPGQVFGFDLALDVGAVVSVDAAGDPALDAALGLYGPRDGTGFFGRNAVASDNDSGEGHLPALGPYPVATAGTYRVVAWTVGGDGAGPLHLALRVDGKAGCATPACPGTPPTCKVNGSDASCDLAAMVVFSDYAGESPRAKCEAVCKVLKEHGETSADGTVQYDGVACATSAEITGLPCAGCCHLSDQPVSPPCDADPCTIDHWDATTATHVLPDRVGKDCEVTAPFVAHTCPGRYVCDASRCPEVGPCVAPEELVRCDGPTPVEGDANCDGLPDSPDQCQADHDCTAGNVCRCVTSCAAGASQCRACVDPKGTWPACPDACVDIEDCPRGSTCALATPPGTEPVYACETLPGQCAICASDADCTGTPGSACLDYGDARFCGLPCDAARDCPVGAACVPDSGEGGAPLATAHCRSLTCCTPSCRTAADCDDGVLCTVDLCDATRNACTHERSPGCCTADAQCDDGLPCTQDACIQNTCQHPYTTDKCCTVDADCADEGNPCTVERCVLDGTTKRYECVHAQLASCQALVPASWGFDGAADLAAVGWKSVSYGTPADWVLSGAGVLGPDDHLRWPDRTDAVGFKSVAVSALIDASASQLNPYNTKQATTLQFRMAYTRGQPGKAAGLKVVASDTADVTGTPLASWTTDEDLGYRLVSLALPDALKFSPTLRVGFLVDAGADAPTGDWDVDDVTVAAGVPNRQVSAKVYVCPAAGCSPVDVCAEPPTGTPTATFAEGEVVEVAMGPCDRAVVITCHVDEDATTSTWNFFGFPGIVLPADAPWFAGLSAHQQFVGCMTLPQAVSAVCGAGATFYCALDLAPSGGDSTGSWAFRAAVRDELGANGSRLQSETPVRIRVAVEGALP